MSTTIESTSQNKSSTELQIEEDESKIPFLCEQDKKPFVVPKNLGPCVNTPCSNATKYICPKCKGNYCSLVCYKEHSTDCVNAFYEESVKAELKGRRADETEQKKMRALLKTYNEQLDEDRKEYEIPQKTLDRLDELEQLMHDNELDLDCLSIQEQQDFAAFIQNQREVQQYIKPWKPWWEIDEGMFSLLITEVESENMNGTNNNNNSQKQKKQPIEIQEVIAYREKMKKRIAGIIEFKRVCKTAPHKDLKFQLLNLICGTALTLRFFNGEIWENPIEAMNFLTSVSISANAKNRIELGSAQNAISEVVISGMRVEKQTLDTFGTLMQADVRDIFKNKIYILEVLYRLFDLLHEGQKELRDLIDDAEEGESKVQYKESMKNLGDMKQKIMYYLSYVRDGLDAQSLKEVLDGIDLFQFEKDKRTNEDSELRKAKKLNLLL